MSGIRKKLRRLFKSGQSRQESAQAREVLTIPPGVKLDNIRAVKKPATPEGGSVHKAAERVKTPPPEAGHDVHSESSRHVQTSTFWPGRPPSGTPERKRVVVVEVKPQPQKSRTERISRPEPAPSLHPALRPGEEPLFVLSGVYKSYGKGGSMVTVLNNMNITIPRGLMVAILGPSGSGKSTLLHILGGADMPDKGNVVYHRNGKSERLMYNNARFMDGYRLGHIGFVFQSLNLMDHLSAWKNVALPLVIKGRTWNGTRFIAERHLNDMGLGMLSRKKPKNMSGGEKQRVAIARAFASRANVILADEPTGNLDRKSGYKVMQLLKGHQEKTGASVIFVTHDTGLACEYCEQCIFEFKDTGVIERVK